MQDFAVLSGSTKIAPPVPGVVGQKCKYFLAVGLLPHQRLSLFIRDSRPRGGWMVVSLTFDFPFYCRGKDLLIAERIVA